MQIRELISSGSFSDLRLLTGDHGLDTDMKDVVLLEYESLKQQQADYYNGDFIISTLYFAKDHPDLLQVRPQLPVGNAAVKQVVLVQQNGVALAAGGRYAA